ncbi:MAG: guanylate kinase [Bacteroidetes bacterium]|nr:MAG: guanylate kinase [Bacteroidota bacterium]RLD73536.1 MAG: guanylate kinase [Bacteroidota bacterium]RLD86075.1 MAG: guanylate kinase [Bacteroidota bacterium]
MEESRQKGKLIIFSAPSGAGKTTLVKYVMAHVPGLTFSVSACSRKKRDNETDGKDYYFLSAGEFKEKIDNQEFIEWEEVYSDHFYGTLYTEVEQKRNRGLHVVFDVDVKGGMNIKKIFGDEALAIFIKPPSIDVLKERLLKRATDSENAIETRIKKAEFELGFEKEFDVTVVNDDLQKAQEETVRIVSQFISER